MRTENGIWGTPAIEISPHFYIACEFARQKIFLQLFVLILNQSYFCSGMRATPMLLLLLLLLP
jgi:hypothetical protein